MEVNLWEFYGNEFLGIGWKLIFGTLMEFDGNDFLGIDGSEFLGL